MILYLSIFFVARLFRYIIKYSLVSHSSIKLLLDSVLPPDGYEGSLTSQSDHEEPREALVAVTLMVWSLYGGGWQLNPLALTRVSC